MKTSPAAAVLALLAALVLGTAFASPALAHDALKSSSPAKDAKVESLDEVKLTFTASVRFPAVVVRGPDDAAHQDGKPAVDGPTVTQKVKADLPPGRYVIAYRVVSSDGHPIEGEIPFTLKGSPSAPATAEAEASPSPAASTSPAVSGQGTSGETAGATGAAEAPAAAAEPASSGGMPGWLWLVVGGLAGIGIGMFFSLRGKGRKQS
ncbi:copper resistance CopC family protein [Streptosporangium sandarakinum]|uniref:copper resistance CopC family protein n=1 Tax=Streptosporangium sandarakinum TaxID=1260955 RepID=UPI003426AD98